MSQVRIRMYRPGGIGDCFLLTFQGADRPVHMLIDCGILKGTPDGTKALQAVMQNVHQETQHKLDILVVTHEHWDHISGFLMAQAEFALLQIDQVWLAWTEEPGNELADELRSQKAKAKKAVAAASMRLQGLVGASPKVKSSLTVMQRLELFYADQDPAGPAKDASPAPSGALSTANAMHWAHHLSGARPRYLDPRKDPQAIPGVPGVRFFVLGPPPDKASIKKENPSKRTPEVYTLASGSNLGFYAALEQAEAGEHNGNPFDASFELDRERARDSAFYRNLYFAEGESWRKIEADWLGSAERLALQLDADTNNTSLVLAIELAAKGKVLLFPGDAQVGSWLSWESLEWTLRDARGEPETVKAADLLERTVLYKVGHHGSHNATLKARGLELMKGAGFTALLPVYEQQARQQGEKGWDMPFPPLLTELKKRSSERVFRADLGTLAGWSKQKKGFYDVQPGWIDVWVSDDLSL
jgi:hypothetical protein